MKGAYTATIKCSTISAARTLLYITAASTKVVQILSTAIGTSGSNTTNQQLEAYWGKITTLGSPTATSITPTPMEQGDQAATSTVAGNCTVEPTTISATITHGRQGFSSLGGYQYMPVPEERFFIPPSGSWALYLASTPTSTDFVCDVSFVEIG